MELTLNELTQRLIRIRWFVLGFPLLTTLLTAIYWYQQPDQYRATTTLMPAAATAQSPLTHLEGLTTLTQLTGIQLGDSGAKQMDIALALLKSKGFIMDFIERRGIKVALLAIVAWDAETQQYRYDTSIYQPDSRQWIHPAKPQQAAEPSTLEAYQAFNDRFQVNYKNDTKAVTLAFTHPSATLASQWLNWLVADLNETMRQREIEAANQNLSYLEKQLSDTAKTQMEQVLYQLVEAETQRKHLANIQPDYVFTTIDQATPPQKPFAPKRITYCLLTLLFSGVICIMSAFLLPISASNGQH